jgi:arginyl-tRNA synthetase
VTSPPTCCKREGDALQRPEGELFGNLPPDEPEGGDKDVSIDALHRAGPHTDSGEDAFRRVLDLGLAAILGDIEQDLGEFGVNFDRWYSERCAGRQRCHRPRAAQAGAARPRDEKDGALWFRATAFGDDKDRVVVRDNGVKTYFASDIAYHLDKRERGFDLLLDILGSDHHGYVATRARGPRRHGRAGQFTRSTAGAVRHAVPRRRESADVDALGRVHHAARAAQ